MIKSSWLISRKFIEGTSLCSVEVFKIVTKVLEQNYIVKGKKGIDSNS